jgi:hypothetical protein
MYSQIVVWNCPVGGHIPAGPTGHEEHQPTIDRAGDGWPIQITGHYVLIIIHYETRLGFVPISSDAGVYGMGYLKGQ